MCNIILKSLEVGDIWNDLVGSLLLRDYVVTSLHFCGLLWPLCAISFVHIISFDPKA